MNYVRMPPAELLASNREIAEMPILPGPRIEELCEGSPWCNCKKPTARSRYHYGERTPEARAANAAYMREYRARKRNGMRNG